MFATTDLHNDEAVFWYLAQDPALGIGGGQPIPLRLIELATALCGDGESCIRLPSPIIAAASAILVYILARRLYDGQVAFWSAVVYATLPAVSAFAMVATPDTAASLVWIAALLTLAIHLERPTLSTGAVLGLLLGAGLLTDSAIVYLPACTALFLAATPAARSALRAPGTWLAAAIAILFALFSFAFFNSRLDFLPRLALSHLNPDATLLFIGLQFVLFGPILFFVLLQSVLFRRAVAPRAPADRFLLFHSVPILALLLFQALFFGAKAHWSLAAYPAAAIFVSALLLRRGLRSVLTFSIGIHVTMLAGILGLSVFAERFRDLPAFDRLMGWRQFAHELSEAAALSDIDTIVLRRDGTVAEAAYYLRDTPIEILAFSRRGRASASDVEGRRDWAYGDPEPVLLATSSDPSAFGIPLGTADKIGEFPVQSYLSSTEMFTLYRVNPPSEPGGAQ